MFNLVILLIELQFLQTKTTNGSGAENEGMLVITSTGFSLTTSIPSTTSPTTTTPTAPSFTPPVITPANPSAPITSSPVE